MVCLLTYIVIYLLDNVQREDLWVWNQLYSAEFVARICVARDDVGTEFHTPSHESHHVCNKCLVGVGCIHSGIRTVSNGSPDLCTKVLSYSPFICVVRIGGGRNQGKEGLGIRMNHCRMR